MYADDDAMATHRTLPHYIAWADFKKDPRDPVLSPTVTKMVSAYPETK